MRRASVMALGLLLATSVSAAAGMSDDKTAYDDCLVERLVKFKNLCEPADQVASAIVTGCNAKLLQLLGNFNDIPYERRLKLMRETESARTQEMMSLLLEYRLEHPCSG